MTDTGPEDTWTGTQLTANLRLVHSLGEGGMGAVYLARHETLGVSYAVKLLHRDLADNPVMMERFRREAYATSRLDHPNVVRIIDFGSSPDDGAAYLVMEYLPGVTLRALLQATDPQPVVLARVLDFLAQLVRGLQAAHDAGVVHRDLKPENLILVSDPWGQDVLKIVDFGLAKLLEPDAAALTIAGEVFGTPQYMSPEQARARDIDQRADIYAFGCLAYELCTGSVPFDADDPRQVMMAQVATPPDPIAQRRSSEAPEVPSALDGFIMRCLEKDPQHRPERLDEILPILEPLIAATQVQEEEEDISPALITQVLTSGWSTLHELPASPPPSPGPSSGARQGSARKPDPDAAAGTKSPWDQAIELAVSLASRLLEVGLGSPTLSALLAEVTGARDSAIGAATELQRVSTDSQDTEQRFGQEANQARWTLCDASLASALEHLQPTPDTGTLVELDDRRTEAEDRFADVSRQQLNHRALVSDSLAALRKGLEAAQRVRFGLEARLLFVLNGERPDPCPASIQQGYDEVAHLLMNLHPT